MYILNCHLLNTIRLFEMNTVPLLLNVASNTTFNLSGFTYRKELVTTVFSVTNIRLSSQGKNKHFCVKQDKVALNNKVKNKKCFLKIKFNSF